MRAPILAGGWYAAQPTRLRAHVDRMLQAAKPSEKRKAPLALIVPHAGLRYSGQVAAYAYRLLQGRRYKRVFLLGPSHRVAFVGAALPSHSHFQTPLGKIPLDQETIKRLAEKPLFRIKDRAHAREHSLEIQLPFLQRVLPQGYRLIPVVIGSLRSPAQAQQLARILQQELTQGDLLLISSDFTHYGARFGYTPFPYQRGTTPVKLRTLDMGAYRQIQRKDLSGFWRYKKKTKLTVCGFYPIAVLLALLPAKAQVDLLRYDTSGRILEKTNRHSFRSSVSYLSVYVGGASWPVPHKTAPRKKIPPQRHASRAKTPQDKQNTRGKGASAKVHILNKRERREALRVARQVVVQCVRQRRCPPSLQQVHWTPQGPFLRRYGVFVTLKKKGRLRGCMGNIFPTMPLYKGILQRAVSAATRDPRFPPLRPTELAHLHLEISVLTPPHQVRSYREIELGRHGILLTLGPKGAVYLPHVATEQGWNLKQTLDSLARKARLPYGAWRHSSARFRLFEAQVFHE